MKDASKDRSFFIFFCEQRLADQFFVAWIQIETPCDWTGEEVQSWGRFSCWKRCVFFLGWCLPWFWMNFNQLTEKVWTFCSCSSQCPGMRRKILKKTRINFGRGQMEFVFGEFSLATSPGRAQTFGQSKSLPLETGRTIRTIYGLFTLPISMDWDGKQTIGNNWKSKQRIDYFIFLDLMDNRMISIQ